MDKLIITNWNGKICTAVISGRKITQLMMEPGCSSSLLNNIYIGKVMKVVDNIGAAFIDIGNGQTGYYSLKENTSHLYVSPPGKRLKAGDDLLVQVSRDAVKTKAPVLTGKLSFTGRYCVLTVGKPGVGFSARIGDTSYKARLKSLFEEAIGNDREDWGVIIRTNAASVEDALVIREYEDLKDRYRKLSGEAPCRTCFSCLYQALPGYIAAIRDSYRGNLEEIITDSRSYYEELKEYLEQYQPEDTGTLVFYQDPLLSLSSLYSLETALERALGKNVWLKSGGYLVIEPTEAMTVIDVNTGKYSGKKKVQETIVKINLEAADEIGRQLRLRNLSGIIIIDFIDMEHEEDRQMLLKHLEEVVSMDPVKTVVVDMTKLNLVEITRKKVRRPLHEQVLEQTSAHKG